MKLVGLVLLLILLVAVTVASWQVGGIFLWSAVVAALIWFALTRQPRERPSAPEDEE